MNFRQFLHPCGLLLLLSLLISSCHGMWDDVGQDCTTHKRIRFTYDWNMLYADAFPHEVKTLTLYAFGSDGKIVYVRQADADSIIAQGYMDVDDMPSGNYRLQVWAQGEKRGQSSWAYGPALAPADEPTATVGDAQGQLSARLLDNQLQRSEDITPLFYGASGAYGTAASADFTDMPLGGVREATVNLMKDTENFRIVLQNQSGETLNPADFHFTITADNGSLDAGNNVVETGDTIAYHAWSVTNAEAGVDSQSGTTITGLSAVVAELTTNRIVKGRGMRLHVTRTSDGKEIVNLPLADLCLLVKGMYNSGMSDQEYLDRQDTWNFVFFLDADRNWLSASILVQSWRVVLQNVNM